MNNRDAPKRGRGRPRSFDKAEAAQKAALVFWKHGYEGTSVEDLTAAMGITTQSLYAAFGSKEELYRQALDWYERAVGVAARRFLGEESNVIRAIERTLQNLARLFTSDNLPRGCMRSTAMLGCAVEHNEIAKHASRLRAATVQSIKDRLDQGVRDRQLQPGSKTAVLAGFIHTVIVGMSVAAQDGATEADLRPYAALAVSPMRKFIVA